MSGRDLAALGGLGFLGYYFSALVNFTGLQYVTVALERVILYSYPPLVLGIFAVLFRKRVRPALWLVCAGCWAGIAVAFAGELKSVSANSRTIFGGSLIWASALSYAFFLIFSASTIQRVGSMRFTSMAMTFSCLFMLMHYVLLRPSEALFQLAPAVYGCC